MTYPDERKTVKFFGKRLRLNEVTDIKTKIPLPAAMLSPQTTESDYVFSVCEDAPIMKSDMIAITLS